MEIIGLEKIVGVDVYYESLHCVYDSLYFPRTDMLETCVVQLYNLIMINAL
jgi:hypothetical protein